MSKVLCIITIPDKHQVHADSVIRHPQCADTDGRLIPAVRLDTVAVFDVPLEGPAYGMFHERIHLLIESLRNSEFHDVKSSAGAV